MKPELRSGWSDKHSPNAMVNDLIAAFGDTTPVVIVFFVAHTVDGRRVCELLHHRYPGAAVVGCTTAGEFTATSSGVGGVCALALGNGKVRQAAAALANFSRGVRFGVDEAIRSMSLKLDTSLRTAAPDRFAGVMLLEGLKMREEEANACLVHVAPSIRFVGGSAGDNNEFRRTRVFVNGQESDDGAALLAMDCAVPFVVSKSCSFESSGHKFRVTRANLNQRIVHELGGKTARDAYAHALDRPPESVDSTVLRRHPMGIMVNGQPWVRSPKSVLSDGSFSMFSQLDLGVEVHILQPTDLIADTKASFADVERQLGRPPQGGLVFNCMLRRRELEERKQMPDLLQLFEGKEVAGFHTYGESLGAHINDTLLALWIA